MIVKILQLSSARTFGGGERHFADLSNALSERGHDVYAALSPASPLQAKLTRLPASHVITLPLRNALDLPSATRLARFIRERRIEIVHAHLARDYPLAAYAARRAGACPFILTRHVPFAMSGLHSSPSRNAARVIAVSEGVARGLCARRIFPDEKSASSRTASPSRQLDTRSEISTAPNFGAALAGRASHRRHRRRVESRSKGQEDFVRAAAPSSAEENFERARVFSSSATTDRAAEKRARALRGLIAEHELRRPRPAPRPRLRTHAAHQFARPLRLGLARGGFRLATLEALMCGVAVVATGRTARAR
jgi:glycosyltransferase involved in cell wall biosynthesis